MCRGLEWGHRNPQKGFKSSHLSQRRGRIEDAANKEWNKIQREKKRQDKAFKRLNAIMERASRPRDYSGRKIKVNAFGEECVRVGNKWVLRSEAPNTYFPDPKDMVEPYLCDCKHCKAKRIRPFQMY